MIKKLIKRLYYKSKYKTLFLGKGCNIGGFDSVFEGNNKIGKNSIYNGYMGYGTYIGSNCSIMAKIGRYCSISDNVKVVAGNHPSKKYVSTHPCFFSTKKQAGFTYVNEDLFEELSYAEDNYLCVVGNDVWIGANVTILNGVKIGDGAIIAMGSVVIKDVEPYSIVGGVPAKYIRFRFSDEQIAFLQKIKWWDKSEDWIKNNVKCFTDIEDFIETHSKEGVK